MRGCYVPEEEVPVLAGHGVTELPLDPVREVALHVPSPASLAHRPCPSILREERELERGSTMRYAFVP